MRRRSLLLSALAMAPIGARAADSGVVDAARKEGALAVADAAPGENFQKFMAAFRAKYPFLDTATGFYSAPTGRVLSRVNAEIDAKRLSFDVMLAANLAAWVDMTRAGKIAQYDSPEYAAYPAGAKDSGHWAASQAIGVIMAYNKNKLPPDQAPKSWHDLLKPGFAGRQIAMQNAASGTQFNQLYLLQQTLGLDYVKQLSAQRPVVMATSAQIVDALARGEIKVAATLDHWRAFEPSAVQAGVVGVYPPEGMPLTLAPVGILAGAPHPNAAKLFLYFILSHDGQELLDTKLYGMYSMRADVPAPRGQKPLADTNPLLPTDRESYIKASANFPRFFEEYFH